MPFLRWLAACALFAPTTGCGATILAKLLADEKPQHYSQYGIEFTHPGDWDAETTVEDVDGLRYVEIGVDGPDAAFVMIQQITPGIEVDRDELMTMLGDELRKENEAQLGGLMDFQQGARETITRTILGSECTGLQSEFSLVLLGQRVPHTTQMFPCELADRTVVIYLQVADEDRADHVGSFDTILDSLAVH